MLLTESIRPADKRALADAAGRRERAEPLPHQLPANRGRYDLARVLRHMVGKLEGRAGALDGIEAEVSREIAVRRGEDPLGIFIPLDVEVRTTLAAGTTGAGAVMQGRGPLIGLLRNRSVAALAGVQLLTDFDPPKLGKYVLPKIGTGAAAAWIGEGVDLTVSSPTMPGVELQHRTVGAMVDLSRQLVKAGPGVDGLAVEDLAGALAAQVDRVVFDGAGSATEPLGLARNAGVPSIPLGANGAALAFSNLVEAERMLGNANAEAAAGALAFVATPNVRSLLRRTLDVATYGRPVWRDGRVLDHPAYATTGLPSNGTKGSGTNLSSAILGNFAGAVVALFGAVDLRLNPYRQNGMVLRVAAYQDADAAARREEMFVRFTDIVTT